MSRPRLAAWMAAWIAALFSANLAADAAEPEPANQTAACCRPPLPSTLPIDKAWAHELLETGRLLLSTGSFERAFDTCSQAAAHPAVRAVALGCMAEAALGLKRYDEAIRLANRALTQKDPPRRDLLLLLGRAYRESRRCRKARPYYQKILRELDPQNAEAQLGLKICE